MAAYRTIEMTLISAKDLNDVNVFSKMDVYAVVSIAGDPRSSQRTPTDKNGGKSPSWNATLRFYVPVDPAAAGRLVLHVLLRAERTLGDRDVGEVQIPLKELLVDGGGKPSSGPQFVSYQVRKTGSGKPKGVLNLSYKFLDAPAAAADHAPPPPVAYPAAAPPPAGYPAPGTDSKPAFAYPAAAPPPPAGYPAPGTDSKPAFAYPAAAPPPPAGYPAPGTDSKPANPVTVNPAPGSSGPAYPPPGKDFKTGEPATAYPPPGPSEPYPHAYPPPPQYGYAAPPAGYGYPPPPQQYGYAPPPSGYGYPPPQAGYGYGAAQPPKKNKFGAGMGAGLGAGLLGGAIGGLLIGDMVSDAGSYDAGYDAGFDDAGGFDF
ncbi:protein SRC2-like [Musa acuminata AAA Group]|uniref:protein SRC2-like n=1 Tax=Musa acuminata AAA Group TaxID=214697 RepID=UPI0031CF217A